MILLTHLYLEKGTKNVDRSSVIHLKVLIIDNSSDQAEDLVGQMQPEICPEDCVFINSFHKALESLVQDSYNIIFISDHYPQDALNHFLKDIKNLKEKNNISLISILEPVKENTSAKKMYLIFLTYQLIEYFVTPKRDTYVPLSNTSKN